MRVKSRFCKAGIVAMLAIASAAAFPTWAQNKASTATKPVRMTVTLQVLGENKRAPEVNREDVIVKQGKNHLKVTSWTPAREEHAGLDLFVLIDDASTRGLGSQLGDLRDFIHEQPESTLVGVGYMRNGTVQVVQDFTNEHGRAADALRLPMASSGAFGSPYLSVIDLMKRWPESRNRREIVMVTDGIDRFRGGQRYRGLSFVSPDVDRASSLAQRTGTMIHTIFTRGVGRVGSNFWEITNGQYGIAKLSSETGGECYYLGTGQPVSFKPYLEELQKVFSNQYLLEFRANTSAKLGQQYIELSTEVAGVELSSADSVWVGMK